MCVVINSGQVTGYTGSILTALPSMGLLESETQPNEGTANMVYIIEHVNFYCPKAWVGSLCTKVLYFSMFVSV